MKGRRRGGKGLSFFGFSPPRLLVQGRERRVPQGSEFLDVSSFTQISRLVSSGWQVFHINDIMIADIEIGIP